MAEATDSVKFQMLQNRLFLNSYLLSGDTREVDRMNEGIHLLGSKIQKGIELSISDQQKAALQKASGSGRKLAPRIREPFSREA